MNKDDMKRLEAIYKMTHPAVAPTPKQIPYSTPPDLYRLEKIYQQTHPEKVGNFGYVGKSLQSGVSGLVENIANMPYLWGGRPVESIKQAAEAIAPHPYVQDKNGSKWAELIGEQAQSLPSNLALIAAAVGAGAASGGLGAAPALATLIAGGTSGLLESASEGAGTYQEALDRGMSHEQAVSAGRKNAAMNVPINVGSDILMGHIGNKIAGRYGKRIIADEIENIEKTLGKAAAKEVKEKVASEAGDLLKQGVIKRAIQTQGGRTAAEIFVNALGEIPEETAQSATNRKALGGNLIPRTKEELYEDLRAGRAGLLGGILQGGAMHYVGTTRQNRLNTKNMLEANRIYKHAANSEGVVSKEYRPTEMYDKATKRIERIDKNIAEIEAKNKPDKYAKTLEKLRAEREGLNSFISSVDEADVMIDNRVTGKETPAQSVNINTPQPNTTEAAKGSINNDEAPTQDTSIDGLIKTTKELEDEIISLESKRDKSSVITFKTHRQQLAEVPSLIEQLRNTPENDIAARNSIISEIQDIHQRAVNQIVATQKARGKDTTHTPVYKIVMKTQDSSGKTTVGGAMTPNLNPMEYSYGEAWTPTQDYSNDYKNMSEDQLASEIARINEELNDSSREANIDLQNKEAVAEENKRQEELLNRSSAISNLLHTPQREEMVSVRGTNGWRHIPKSKYAEYLKYKQKWKKEDLQDLYSRYKANPNGDFTEEEKARIVEFDNLLNEFDKQHPIRHETKEEKERRLKADKNNKYINYNDTINTDFYDNPDSWYVHNILSRIANQKVENSQLLEKETEVDSFGNEIERPNLQGSKNNIVTTGEAVDAVAQRYNYLTSSYDLERAHFKEIQQLEDFLEKTGEIDDIKTRKAQKIESMKKRQAEFNEEYDNSVLEKVNSTKEEVSAIAKELQAIDQKSYKNEAAREADRKRLASQYATKTYELKELEKEAKDILARRDGTAPYIPPKEFEEKRHEENKRKVSYLNEKIANIQSELRNLERETGKGFSSTEQDMAERKMYINHDITKLKNMLNYLDYLETEEKKGNASPVKDIAKRKISLNNKITELQTKLHNLEIEAGKKGFTLTKQDGILKKQAKDKFYQDKGVNSGRLNQVQETLDKYTRTRDEFQRFVDDYSKKKYSDIEKSIAKREQMLEENYFTDKDGVKEILSKADREAIEKSIEKDKHTLEIMRLQDEAKQTRAVIDRDDSSVGAKAIENRISELENEIDRLSFDPYGEYDEVIAQKEEEIHKLEAKLNEITKREQKTTPDVVQKTKQLQEDVENAPKGRGAIGQRRMAKVRELEAASAEKGAWQQEQFAKRQQEDADANTPKKSVEVNTDFRTRNAGEGDISDTEQERTNRLNKDDTSIKRPIDTKSSDEFIKRLENSNHYKELSQKGYYIDRFDKKIPINGIRDYVQLWIANAKDMRDGFKTARLEIEKTVRNEDGTVDLDSLPNDKKAKHEELLAKEKNISKQISLANTWLDQFPTVREARKISERAIAVNAIFRALNKKSDFSDMITKFKAFLPANSNLRNFIIDNKDFYNKTGDRLNLNADTESIKGRAQWHTADIQRIKDMVASNIHNNALWKSLYSSDMTTQELMDIKTEIENAVADKNIGKRTVEDAKKLLDENKKFEAEARAHSEAYNRKVEEKQTKEENAKYKKFSDKVQRLIKDNTNGMSDLASCVIDEVDTHGLGNIFELTNNGEHFSYNTIARFLAAKKAYENNMSDATVKKILTGEGNITEASSFVPKAAGSVAKEYRKENKNYSPKGYKTIEQQANEIYAAQKLVRDYLHVDVKDGKAIWTPGTPKAIKNASKVLIDNKVHPETRLKAANEILNFFKHKGYDIKEALNKTSEVKNQSNNKEFNDDDMRAPSDKEISDTQSPRNKEVLDYDTKAEENEAQFEYSERAEVTKSDAEKLVGYKEDEYESSQKYKITDNKNTAEDTSPKVPINEETLGKAFNGSQVTETEDGDFLVTFKNGSCFKVTTNGNFVVDYDVIEKTYGKSWAEAVKKGDAQIIGTMDFRNGVPLMTLAEGMTSIKTLNHEIFHFAARSVLTRRELAALRRRYGEGLSWKKAEEKISDAYGDFKANRLNKKDSIFQKLLDTWTRVKALWSVEAMAEKAFLDLESGKTFERIGVDTLEAKGIRYGKEKTVNPMFEDLKDGIGGVNYSGSGDEKGKSTLGKAKDFFSKEAKAEIWREFQRQIVADDLVIKHILGDDIYTLHEDARYSNDQARIFFDDNLVPGLKEAHSWTDPDYKGSKEEIAKARENQLALDRYMVYMRAWEAITNNEKRAKLIQQYKDDLAAVEKVLAKAKKQQTRENAMEEIEHLKKEISKLERVVPFDLGKNQKEASHYLNVAKEIAKQYPDVVKAERAMVNFDHMLLEKLYKAGCITEASYNNLVRTGAHYANLSRDIDTSTSGKNVISVVQSVFDGKDIPINSYQEGHNNTPATFTSQLAQAKILSEKVFEAIKTQKVHDAIMKKIDTFEKEQKAKGESGLEGIIGRVKEGGKIPKGCEEWNPLQKGIRQKYYVCPELKAALDITKDYTPLSMWEKAVKALNSITVLGATRTLGFATNNSIQDSLVAGATTKRFVPLVDSIRCVTSAFLEDDFAKDFLRRGGQGIGWGGKEAIIKQLGPNYVGNKSKITPIRKVWNELGHIIEASEICTRLGVYKRQIENLTEIYKKEHGEAPVGEALEKIKNDAARFSRDSLTFNRGGVLTKKIGRFVPFFQPAIQGNYGFMKKLFPNGKLNKAVLIRCCYVYTLSALMLNLFNHLTPEQREKMDNLEPWQRYGYYNINIPGKNMIRISRSHLPSILFSVIPEMVIDKMFRGKKDFDFLPSVLGSIFGGLTPNMAPGFLKAWLENKTGYSFRYDRKRDRIKDKDLPTHMRFNDHTKDTFIVVSKLLHKMNLGKSEWLDISPDDLQNYWEQTTGGIGQDFISFISDPIAKKFTGREREARAFYTKIPSLNRFIWDTTEQKGVVNDFRNRADGLGRKVNAMKIQAEDGGIDSISSEYKKYLSSYGAITELNKKYIGAINKCNSNIREIRSMKRLSPEEKRKHIDKQRKIAETISRRGIEIINKIEKRAGEAK